MIVGSEPANEEREDSIVAPLNTVLDTPFLGENPDEEDSDFDSEYDTSDSSSSSHHQYEKGSERKSNSNKFWISPDIFIAKKKPVEETPDKFWITPEIFIEKKKPLEETPLKNESQSVTCHKIEYKCAVVREHSQKCNCVTPRLHIYLLFGHQCNSTCANWLRMDKMCNGVKEELISKAIKVEEESDDEGECLDKVEEREDGEDIAIKIENEVMEDPQDNSTLLEDESCSEPGSLTIDTEYVVVSDETLNISPHCTSSKSGSNDHKSSSEIGLDNKNSNSNNNCSLKTNKMKLVNLSQKLPKSFKRKKRENVSTSKRKKVCQMINPLQKLETSLNSGLQIKEEEPDDTSGSNRDFGIPANDFQQELQKIALSINKSNMTAVSAVPSEDAYNLLKSFESLVKEDPEKNQNESSSPPDDAVFASLQVSDIFEKEDPELLTLPIQKEASKPNDGVFTIKTNSVESNGKVVGCVSYVTPTKMKILFCPLKKEIKNEPNTDDGDQITNETSGERQPNSKKGQGEAHLSELVETGVDSVDEAPESPSIHSSDVNDPEACAKEGANSKRWKCNLCTKNYHTFVSLTDHLEMHQKNGLILCFYCQKSFGDRTSMKRHMRMHTGERPYQCKICNKKFSLPGNFKKHRDIHEDIRSEPCDVCGKTFRRREHLKYHMRTHTGEKPFECSLCPSSFTARYSLQIHMNIHLGKKPYKCSYCNKAFCDKSTMRKHIRTHTGERPFKCKVCAKGFSESGTLASHMATHTEDRPFSCTKCDLKFKTNGGLRQHYKIHSGEKHFECKYCGMRFLQRYNMTMHERIHTNEKPYSCCECGRCFRSRSCLAKHIVIHAGDQERKHSCTHCDKKFFRKAHLSRHINMHLGVKEHECQVCAKTFCSNATLRGHIRTFHTEGARNFPCDRCDKVFKRQIYVSTHKCSNRVSSENDDETESEEVFAVKIEQE